MASPSRIRTSPRQQQQPHRNIPLMSCDAASSSNMDVVVAHDDYDMIPRSILQGQSKHHSYCTGASQGRWHCLGTQLLRSEDDTIQYSFHVWYSPPSQHHHHAATTATATATRGEQLTSKAIPFLKLEHYKLCAKFMDGSDETPPPPLLAMHTTGSSSPFSLPDSSSSSSSGVWIYIANPVTGALVVWRLDRDDLKRPLAPPNAALVHVPIAAVAMMDRHSTTAAIDDSFAPMSSPAYQQQADQLTSLTVSSTTSTIPTILLGSRQGNIFWVKQTQIPVALHVQQVQPSTRSHPEGGGGLLTRYLLWGSTSSTASLAARNANAMAAAVLHAPIVTNLVLQTTEQQQQQQPPQFVTITETGHCVVWKVTPTESHRALFDVHTVLSLQEALSANMDGVEQIHVIGATWNDKTQQLHVLFYAFMSPSSSGGSSDNIESSRLYWARLLVEMPQQPQGGGGGGGSGGVTATLQVQQMTWLNRFADPHNDVLLTGLAATDNGLAYAVFRVEPDQNDTLYPAHYIRLGQDSPPSVAHSTVVMVMDYNPDTDRSISSSRDSATDSEIHEGNIVLPRKVATLLPGTICRDVATHGVSLWDASGVKIRIRWRDSTPEQQQQRVPSPSKLSTTTMRGTSRTKTIAKLQLHLQSVFWDSYTHPDRELRLPPSLTMADAADLEQAIVEFAQQLQRKDDVSAAHCMDNPLEWHLALVDLLQQAGIYRSLSWMCRWKLLAVGQEVCAFWTLCRMSAEKQWEQAYRAQLTPDGVAPWLEGVHKYILAQQGGGEDRETKFLEWFCAAVEAAMKYREERASECYDVDPNVLPISEAPEEVPVWTCSSSLLSVWDQQLAKWVRGLSSTASQKVVETMTTFVLQSRRDLYLSCPIDRTKKAYVRDQKDAFALLRSVNGWKKDMFAFDLCIEHCYFGGLCDIALDHEKRGDRVTFSLDPLFEKLKEKRDVGSDMSFGRYVLNWHTKWSLPGHVLRYGEYCPDDLNVLINTESSLQPYKWIHSIRRGDYENAASTLVDHANSGGLKLRDTVNALSCADVANQVVEMESSSLKARAEKRRRLIGKKRELASAQNELLGDEGLDRPLMPAETLLELSMKKFEECREPEDKAECCFIGLAVCSGFHSFEDATDNAIKLWCRAIGADLGKWDQWLSTETDLTDSRLRDLILGDTVFGMLLNQTRDAGTSETWESILFTNARIENGVLATLDPAGSEKGRKMQRLLCSVAKIQH